MSSSVSCGIVGLPNVGKSTLFNALSHNNALIANYPFATIEPNTGIVPVPDERLTKLASLYNTHKIIQATVTFIDVAGLVSGASQGEGLGNRFLGHVRSCDAILQVVRAFNDENVIHVDQQHNPASDIDIINTELMLSDLQIIENRLPRLHKESSVNAKLKPVFDALESAHKVLNEGKLLFGTLNNTDLSLIDDMQLITTKPIIYFFNLDELELNNDKRKKELSQLVYPADALFGCAKLEDELKELDEVDASELLASYGQIESSLMHVIKAAYEVLGLQSFLTAGEKEVRAWTIRQGSTAPQAAGAIHTDFQRGFIAAEIINYPDLIEAGSYVKARQAGKVRTEGKDYVMQPNDVVEFRFNV